MQTTFKGNSEHTRIIEDFDKALNSTSLFCKSFYQGFLMIQTNNEHPRSQYLNSTVLAKLLQNQYYTYHIPVKPSGHKQANPSIKSWHIPWFLQVTLTQSSMFSSHRLPLVPLMQLHLKSLARSWHTALCKQGLERHSSISTSQLFPVHPGLQVHLYE